jgi:hypothetical protein
MSGVKKERDGLPTRPVEVCFIDNRLGKHHQAFVNPPVYFDMELQKYVPSVVDQRSLCQDEHPDSSRPPPSAVEAMNFWNVIFPESLSDLNKHSPRSKELAKSPYSIRNAKNWEEVRDLLTTARESYENPDGSIMRKFRKGVHKAGEHTQPVRRALDVVKDVQYISPVVVAVQIVLDVSVSSQ